MTKNKTASKSLTAKERQLQAVELRHLNLSYRQIGEKLGVSPAQAHRYVEAALKELNDKLQEKAEGLRALQRDRLDRMARGLWPRAQNGDEKAVNSMLKIMEREAALTGIDAPRKYEDTTPGDSIAERLRAEMDE